MQSSPSSFVHPIVAEVKKARKLREAGKSLEAQKLLRDQLRIYPQAPETRDARELLGEINAEMFFSADSLFGKTEYLVQRGDTLSRIAKKLNSSPDMIIRANSLDYWEGRVHLDYTLGKNAAIIGQWHSDYGWGAGLRVQF